MTMRKAPSAKLRDESRPGGTFMRAGDLASLMPPNANCLLVPIDTRATTKENAAQNILGPAVGRFGVDVPVTVGGTHYIVTLPDFTTDYEHLVEAFGDNLEDWAGRGLALWTQEVNERGPSGDSKKLYIRFCPSEEAIKAQEDPTRQLKLQKA